MWEKGKQIFSFRGNIVGFNIPGSGLIPLRIESWVSDLKNKVMDIENNLATPKAEIKQLKLCVPAAMGLGIVPGNYAIQRSYISANRAGNGGWDTAGIGGTHVYSESSWMSKAELGLMNQ